MLGCDFEPGMWVRHKKLGFKGRVKSVCLTRGNRFHDRNTYAIRIGEGVTESVWEPHELEIIPDEPTIKELKDKIAELEFVAEKQKEAIKEWEKAYKLVTPIPHTCTHVSLHIDGKVVVDECVPLKP